MLFAIIGVATAVGIAFQLAKGVTRIGLHFYLVDLFVLLGLQMMMIAVLATFVQALVNQKYIGLVVVLILVIVVPLTVDGLEARVPLLHFATYPTVPLSDMNQFGHFLPAAFWFLAYWGCVSVLLGVAAHALWIRGIPASLRARLRGMRAAMTPAVTAVAVARRHRHGGRSARTSIGIHASSTPSSRRRMRGSAPSTTRRPTGNSRRCRSRGSPRSRWRSISIRRPAASCRAAASPGEPEQRADRNRPRAVRLRCLSRQGRARRFRARRCAAALQSFRVPSIRSACARRGANADVRRVEAPQRLQEPGRRLVGAVQRNLRAQRRAGAVDRRVGGGGICRTRSERKAAWPRAVSPRPGSDEKSLRNRGHWARRFRLHPFRHHALDQRRPDRARAGLYRARVERRWAALFPLRDGHADPEFLVGAVGALRGGARQME